MSTDQMDFDRALDVCRTVQCRIVLAVLAEEQRPLTIRDLAQAVLKHDHQLPPEEATAETYEHILADLHHTQLPKLEDAGIIEYDPARRQAEPADQFDHLWSALSAIIDLDPNLCSRLEL